jgi:hypothetical protein
MKPSTYPWRAAYVSAILEVDEAQITERIYKAIAAIELRRLSPWKIDDDERHALDAADQGIQAFVTERTEKTVLVRHFQRGPSERRHHGLSHTNLP